MAKGLDYIINLKDGDFGGASKAKTAVQGLDNAVEHTHEGLGSLKGMLLEVGEVMAEAFAIEKIIDFGKESLAVYRSTAAAEAQIAQGIKTTAGIAGLSLDELREKAEELEHKTLFTQAQTEQAEAIQLTFTNIRGAIFNQAIPAIEDLATRMGGDGPADLKGAAVQLDKALQDPITGIASLHRVGVSFSDAQKEMIKTDVEHGQVQKAQALILKELQAEFGGSAEAARSVLGPAGDLDEKMEVLKKGFGHFIDDSLRVIIPLIFDVGHGIQSIGGALADGYHWVKDNADIFKGLGIAVASAGLAYAVLNPNIILGTIATGAQALIVGTLSVAIDVWTAAQWALNVAMDANPIGLIIVGIGALVGGLYIAYQRSETFRAVLSGIGEAAMELWPIFKGLGEVIWGALTFDPSIIKKGFDDSVKGVQAIITSGGLSGAFNRGYDNSLAKSKKDEAAKKEADGKKEKTTSASELVHHGEKHTPYSISTGGRGGKGSGDSASLTGGRSVRNVTVTIGKLVERLEVHTTNLQGAGSADIKRMLTELLTQAVHDSELALGSQ